jgi:2-oxoisovalerate dehydrogenase E1 component
MKTNKQTFGLLNDRNRNDLFSFYVRSLFIRKFESLLLDLFAEGKISGTTHTSLGQEATAVGIAAACKNDDIFVSNHRCHAHLLSHVGNPDKLLNEVMGDASGYCSGVGGSQHICVKDKFFSNGIQGGTLPLAAGLAFAKKYQNKRDIVCVFMGDGTTGEGAVYEALNLVACYKLPILIVVEDNDIAQTTLTQRTIAGSIRKRFEAFNIKVEEISYPTASEIHMLAAPLVDHVRLGNPAAIIVKSARLGPHSKGDDTRDADYLSKLKKLDPMLRMEHEIKSPELLNEAEYTVDQWINTLKQLAKNPKVPSSLRMASYLEINFKEADFSELDGSIFIKRINDQLTNILANLPGSLIIGEDIGDPYGGAFKITKGLQTQYPEQVFESPISELGIVGLAAGAALLGIRPIVEIMFGDFSLLALDQLVNHAAKYPLMYDGIVTCPLIVRMPMGGGRGYGPTHSQSLEKHFCGITNLQVVALSAYFPIKPIFDSIMNAKGPVIIIENKSDYTRKIDYSTNVEPYFNVRTIAGGVVYSPLNNLASSVLICAYGGMIGIALDVAKELAKNNISATVLAVVTLHPFDDSVLLEVNSENSFELVVSIEENTVAWGFGSEIAAHLCSPKFKNFSNNFIRIGALDTTIPASREMEKEVLPDLNKILNTINSALSVESNNIYASVDSTPRVSDTFDFVEVKAMQLNANDDQLKIIEYLVNDESEVSIDQLIITVETSKAINDITAPASGYIVFMHPTGADVQVGSAIAHIYKTREDAQKHAKLFKSNAISSENNLVASSQLGSTLGEEFINFSKVQAGMNKTLRISHQEVVPSYLMTQCKLLRPVSRNIDLIDVLIYHAAKLANHFPNVNSKLQGQGLIRRKKVDFGFTTDNNGDLYVGVIRDAALKSIEEIASNRMDIVLSLFRGDASQSMISEPTICVTTLNGKWVAHQIPVVFPNTALMIGFNQRVSSSDEVEAYITFAYDHRIVSGFEVSSYAEKLISELVNNN